MSKNSVQRFREIVKTLAFYGYGYIVGHKIKNDKNNPKNLRKAFEDLGPTFIKIGQILSTRPDLLSPEYIDELSKLQDNVASEPFKNIETVFIEEFNKPIDQVFKQFNRVPLASASMAQVHEAILRDGTNVIVKIQRPKIALKMALDISILYKISKLAKSKLGNSIIDLDEALDELKISTEQELDFRNEAKNIECFRKLNKDEEFIVAPYVVHDLSKERVITMEKIDGIKVSNSKKLKEKGYNLSDIGKRIALSYCKQVFEDGFFHGDPHPGNILISNGKICFIDFGIMGTLSKSLKSALSDMMFAVASRDINKLVSVIMSIGIKRGYVNRNKLFEDIDYLMDSYLSTSLSNIKISSLLEDLLDTAKQNNIRLPKDFTMLIRSLLIIEGVIVKLSPDIQIIDVVISYVKNNNNFSISDINLNEILIRGFLFTKDSSRLPTKLIELSDSILQGRAKIQLEYKNLNKTINELHKMINRLIISLVISSMIIGSSLVLNTNVGPKHYNISLLGLSGFAIAAFMGLLLLISILRSGKI